MALARYKDLCIDAVDPARAGVFWSGILGLAAEPRGDEVRLMGPTLEHMVWINRVPEPVTVKQRVHLDVFGPDAEWAGALGASVQLMQERWTTMLDPEGGEFCVFPRAAVPPYRLYELGVDSVDARALAHWWADVFGSTAETESGKPWWWIEGIEGLPFESFVFQSVPEPKTVKNRIHWDVWVDDLPALIDAGATVLRRPDAEVRWTVLADPEGNEFCAFTG